MLTGSSKKIEDGGGELRRSFEVREVGCGKFEILRIRYVICNEAAIGGRRRGIVRSSDDEGGNFNGSEFSPGVKIAKSGAAGRVSLRICGFDHFHGERENFWTRGLKFRSEPADGDGVRNFLHPFRENGFDAGVPKFGSADFCAGIA